VAGDVAAGLAGCGSGRELVADGWGEELAVAAEVDASTSVPVLRGESFRSA
jgi:2-phosphosulfolactate phosphatase